MIRRLLPLAVALALTVGITSCGSDEAADTAAPVVQLDSDVLPSTILGLNVKLENVAKRMAGVERPYVSKTGLYSLRDGKELQATLQVSVFNDEALPDDREFRLAIVNQIGSTDPKAFRMGDETVYLTASKRQAVAVLFREHSFAVLSTLDTYERGRSLLREILELDL